MATSKSAKKRIRQSETKRVRNRSAKSALRTAVKKFGVAVTSGDAATAAAALRVVQKTMDKTAGKGIIRKKTAARIKSRLAAKTNALKGAKSGAE